MKKWIALLLSLSVMISLAACQQKDDRNDREKEQENDGLVTIYCLVREDSYSNDALTSQTEYQYDTSGNLIGMKTSIAGSSYTYTWNAELETYVYEYTALPFEESARVLYENQYDYDDRGNITRTHYKRHDEDGSIQTEKTEYYSYYYNDKDEIIYAEYKPEMEYLSPLNYYFTYEDGRVVNVDVYMATDDGEQYGERVNRFQFEYDDKGRLCTEDIIYSNTEYHYSYTYDQSDRVESAACREMYYDEESQYIHKFNYDLTKNLITDSICEEDDSVRRDHIYYSNDQVVYLGNNTKLELDKNGNLISSYLYDDDSRCEYTYEAIQVTEEQAQRYYRQQQMLFGKSRGWNTDHYYPVFFYHLIPNPIW